MLHAQGIDREIERHVARPVAQVNREGVCLAFGQPEIQMRNKLQRAVPSAQGSQDTGVNGVACSTDVKSPFEVGRC